MSDYPQPMTEKTFREELAKWLKHDLAAWLDTSLARNLPEGQTERLAVVSSLKLDTGWMAWFADEISGEWDDWTWSRFPREIDAAIVLNVRIDGASTQVPLVALELKTGVNLNTDEINKKSSVYSLLKEVYPFCLNALVIKQYGKRRRYGTLIRNARAFDRVFASWGKAEQEMLSASIQHHLDYVLHYHTM